MADLLYGVRLSDGKTVSINDIPDNMFGLSCECVCVLCGKALQACSLNGKVRRYFRHHTGFNDINCDASTANETALHKMAKEIIEIEKSVFVPARNISLEEAGIKGLPADVKKEIKTIEYQKPKVIQGFSAISEKSLNSFTPDLILNTQRGELLIEIFVSHRVDIVKKQKVCNYGSRMIEIDLSSFKNRVITRDEIRNIILSENNLTTWISYPLSKNVIDKAYNHYENLDVVRKHRKSQLQKAKREKEDFEKQELYNLEREMRIQRIRRINMGTKKHMELLANKEKERKEREEQELYRKNHDYFLKHFDEINGEIKDSLGVRWYKCEKCCDIITEYEVAFLLPNNPKMAKCKKCY